MTQCQTELEGLKTKVDELISAWKPYAHTLTWNANRGMERLRVLQAVRDAMDGDSEALDKIKPNT
jgi:hypothetical protein